MPDIARKASKKETKQYISLPGIPSVVLVDVEGHTEGLAVLQGPCIIPVLRYTIVRLHKLNQK